MLFRSIVTGIADIFYSREKNGLTQLPFFYNIFKKLTSNTITFILIAIYYIIREYRSSSRITDNFYNFTISGLYISGILLLSFIL